MLPMWQPTLWLAFIIIIFRLFWTDESPFCESRNLIRILRLSISEIGYHVLFWPRSFRIRYKKVNRIIYPIQTHKSWICNEHLYRFSISKIWRVLKIWHGMTHRQNGVTIIKLLFYVTERCAMSVTLRRRLEALTSTFVTSVSEYTYLLQVLYVTLIYLEVHLSQVPMRTNIYKISMSQLVIWMYMCQFYCGLLRWAMSYIDNVASAIYFYYRHRSCIIGMKWLFQLLWAVIITLYSLIYCSSLCF